MLFDGELRGHLGDCRSLGMLFSPFDSFCCDNITHVPTITKFDPFTTDKTAREPLQSFASTLDENPNVNDALCWYSKNTVWGNVAYNSYRWSGLCDTNRHHTHKYKPRANSTWNYCLTRIKRWIDNNFTLWLGSRCNGLVTLSTQSNHWAICDIEFGSVYTVTTKTYPESPSFRKRPKVTDSVKYIEEDWQLRHQ